MTGPNVRFWTGVFGIAGFIIFLAALPLYFLGPAAVLPKDANFTSYVTSTNTYTVTRAAIADPLLLCCFLIFLAGLRHLVREANPDYEWVSTAIFGAGLLYIALQLAGDALQAAGALDTLVGPNQSVVRALFEASAPFYSAVGLIPEAFFLAFAGYATVATRVLPKGTGWFAYAGAVIALAATPTIYLGFSGLIYQGAGVITAFAQFWSPLWTLIASLVIIRKKTH